VQTGPAVHFVKVLGEPVPQLAGQAVMNTATKAIGAGLRGSCQLTVTRDDLKLASFRWVCGTAPAGYTGATFEVGTGRRVGLGDLFTGGYEAYLQSTAAAQLQAQGATNLDTSNLSLWDLTADTLEISFPGGAVGFPIASLAAYVKPGGPLAP
jgi:hypothetical protein